MVYRNTPLGSGKSLAELLLERNPRTNLFRGVNNKRSEEFKQKDKDLKEY